MQPYRMFSGSDDSSMDFRVWLKGGSGFTCFTYNDVGLVAQGFVQSFEDLVALQPRTRQQLREVYAASIRFFV